MRGPSLTVLATVFRVNKFEGKGGTCFLCRNLRLRPLVEIVLSMSVQHFFQAIDNLGVVVL